MKQFYPPKERIPAGKYFLLFIAILALLINTTYSQFTWQKTYHPVHEGDEEAFDICSTTEGYYYIGGMSAPGSRYVYIIKIDQLGDTLWTGVYGLGQIHAIESTTDGGCIYAGVRGSTAIAGRINVNGDTLWKRTYNAINFMDIKKTIDGNYILCGVEYSSGTYNGYVCKIDSTGSIIWDKIYYSSLSMDLFTIEKGITGGFIFGGIKRDFSGGPRYSYICKINDTGLVEWEKSYQLSLDNFASGIQHKNNGYLIAGRTMDNAYVLKTNINGDSLSINVIQNTENIYSSPALIRESDNKFYLAHINGFESRVYSIDSNLNIMKTLILQNGEGLSIQSLTKAVNSSIGDIILVGITAFEVGNGDAYAVRLDSALNPPPPISILINSSHLPEVFELFQNYPNPFNGTTVIKFSIKEKAHIQIKIFDFLGREVKTLVSETLNTGIYSKIFSDNTFSSGVYFYQLIADNKIISTHKMILVK